MLDKELLRLLGSNRKYIFYTVAVMMTGLLANLSITAGICVAIYLLTQEAEPGAYILPALLAAGGIIVRYAASRVSGNLKDILGRKAKKDLREKTYDKIVRLGVRSTDGMSIAGLTQVSMEGLEGGGGAYLLCSAYPGVHYCGVEVRQEDIREILGEVHFYGRQLPGQRTGTARAENITCGRCPA